MRFDPIRAGYLNWIKLLRRNPVLGACAEPESSLESEAWAESHRSGRDRSALLLTLSADMIHAIM